MSDFNARGLLSVFYTAHKEMTNIFFNYGVLNKMSDVFIKKHFESFFERTLPL